MRKKFIIANHKCYLTNLKTYELLEKIKQKINFDDRKIIICTCNSALENAQEILEETNINLGAQNISQNEKANNTGENSINNLIEMDIKYCIVGHSERREKYFENDKMINDKIKLLFEKNIIPILCVGENEKEYLENMTENILRQQLRENLKDVEEKNLKKIIIAYEPIFAIGTGKTVEVKSVIENIKIIRNIIKELYNEEVSQDVTIVYGGSVNGTNAKEFLNEYEIDGVLVGGASTTDEFVSIVNSIN